MPVGHCELFKYRASTIVEFVGNGISFLVRWPFDNSKARTANVRCRPDGVVQRRSGSLMGNCSSPASVPRLYLRPAELAGRAGQSCCQCWRNQLLTRVALHLHHRSWQASAVRGPEPKTPEIVPASGPNLFGVPKTVLPLTSNISESLVRWGLPAALLPATLANRLFFFRANPARSAVRGDEKCQYKCRWLPPSSWLQFWKVVLGRKRSGRAFSVGQVVFKSGSQSAPGSTQAFPAKLVTQIYKFTS